ncbi:MAG: response regulator [Ktedonobacteraceae bacterium]
MNEKQQAMNRSVQEKYRPILVVDDDHNLRQTIQWVLEEEGFSVSSAADGQEAVEQAMAQQPGLVILDMGLPLLNGSEVAAQVHARYGAAVPIILITADGQAEEKSRRVRATSFLRKPFDIDDLVDAVQQALARP